MSYWTLQNLRDLCGVATTLACLDDNNTGVESSTAVTLLQNLSDRKVDARIATEHPEASYPLANPPELIVNASLLYGKAMLYERRPEYVKIYGDKAMLAADRFLEDIMRQPEYLTDALGPGIGVKPANVGGAVVDNGPRIAVDGADGTRHGGDY